MKRHILYLVFAAGLIMACEKENESGTGASKNPVAIEVEYSRKGIPVTSNLSLGASGQSVNIDVKINNDNIYWNMESDKDWCQVVEAEHKGSGIITLNITANASFDAREESALLTFRSGQYSKAAFTVTQSGNFFIVKTPYMVKTKDAGSVVIDVEVPGTEEWTFEPDGWITAEKGTPAPSENGIIYPVTISWEENTDISRYGTVGLIRSGEEEAESRINIWQFGSEVYNDGGELILAAGSDDLPFGQAAAEFEIKAPASYISTIACPDWMSYDGPVETDDIATFRFFVERNPSDTKTVREYALEMSVVADDVTKITVPVIRQDFYSAGGIISANGLKMFAEAVNAGEDISTWQQGNEVVLINNIDMSKLDGEWVPVGTAENPFTGRFNGDYNKIQKFKASAPIFGVCRDASISSVFIDESCTITVTEEAYTECFAAPLAASLENCTVTYCENFAKVELTATTGNTGAKAYVSGLIANATGATSVKNCKNYGPVEIAGEARAAVNQKNAYFHLAGIVAVNGEGSTLEGCVNSGALKDAGTAFNHYIGGIAAQNSGTVKESVSEGEMSFSSVRVVDAINDASRNVYWGGIVGHNDGAIESCQNNSIITSTSDIKMQYIGGISGVLASDSKVQQNINGSAHAFNIDGGVRQLLLGGLYGEVGYDAVLDFSAESDIKTAKVTVKKHEVSNTVYLHVGGIVGRGSKQLEIRNPKVEWTLALTAGSSNDAVCGAAAGIGGVVGASGVIQEAAYSGGPLTISDAVCNGEIRVTNSTFAKYYYFGVGGVVGFVADGGAVLTNCTNNTAINGIYTSTSRSNGYGELFGGIAGYIAGGTSVISGCQNTAGITNDHYNNNAWEGKTNGTGGIIGAYGYKTTLEGTITISDCVNTGTVTSHRGMAGGIAGYVRNGTVSGCDNTGSLGNGQRSYIGGIAGVVQNTEITDCEAVCNVSGQKSGSATYNGGGIAGALLESSECTGCSYSGKVISITDNATDYLGGLAGLSDNTCVFENCRFGGSLTKPSTTITVSAENVAEYAVGEGGATVSGIEYWNVK